MVEHIPREIYEKMPLVDQKFSCMFMDVHGCPWRMVAPPSGHPVLLEDHFMTSVPNIEGIDTISAVYIYIFPISG